MGKGRSVGYHESIWFCPGVKIMHHKKRAAVNEQDKFIYKLLFPEKEKGMAAKSMN